MIDWANLNINSLADLKKQLPDDPLKVEDGDYPDMADTVGSLVDKLAIVNLKMWNNQEILYEIRRMTPEEFEEKYEDDIKKVYQTIKICCDMNVLRNQLIDEVNDRFGSMVLALGGTQKDIDSLRLRAPSHKSY